MAKWKPDAIQEMWVDDHKIPVKIFLEKRNNSRVSIAKSGVLIRIPILLHNNERQTQISKFRKWAEDKIKLKPQLIKRSKGLVYQNMQSLKVGLYTYQIYIMHTGSNCKSGKLIDEIIALNIDETLDEQEKNKTISWLVYKVVADHQKSQIVQRILRLNEQHFQQPIRQIRIKNNATNWGSCSGKRNINISARLLFAPGWVQDYVCIHELAHLIEPNHSSRFWALVENAMPGYKEAERWLRDNSHLCRF